MPAPLFRMEGISKRHGGVRALENARLTCERGRIHAVLGENGAGKSTLIKVMSGVVRPDAGTMELEGRRVAFDRPAAATRAGVVSVFQELSLLPDLTVADNVVITNPPSRLGLIRAGAQRRIAEEVLHRVGADDIHPLTPVRDLPLSRRQLVEIAKALARRPKILILDEATSALTAADVAAVFRVLRELRDEGLAIVYISHRMQEIAELADDCSVFRNGAHVASFKSGEKSSNEIVEMMIGREYENVYPQRLVPGPDRRALPPALKVSKLSWAGRLRDIDFEVRPGEIVGLGGLEGQGQRSLLLALFGALIGVEGTVEARGGVALIPEDRKTEGLMLPMSVRDNLSFAALERFCRLGVIDRAAQERGIREMVELLSIRADAIDGPVAALSGGNQQKVVIGKWLLTRPRIILLNDPTRGIDVGTKQELYRLLRTLADQDAAILFYSTDYDELIGCCDKVLMMYDGAIIRVLEGEAINERNIVATSLNVDEAS
jgi:ribose transport system ATP-binding protein